MSPQNAAFTAMVPADGRQNVLKNSIRDEVQRPSPVDTIMSWMKIMNVVVFVVLRLACMYDVGRYVFFGLTVPVGKKEIRCVPRVP